ncbi:MAG: DNA repair protein RecN [Candidatus Eremiobacteraeota bacterium]|nr:DNA repair protein RecN [Candidatus Eremiobacteraeota bacterium]
MLVELQIENFALIDSVQLEFREGLNVLTGETGAGKSIVLDALGFLLGDPARDAVSKRARVTGRFLLSAEARRWLVEQGWDEDDEAIALREVSPGGRSLCRLNGALCSLAQLRELGNLMLEIHSQHQSNRLLRPSRHLELLDRLSEHQPLLEAYRDLYRESQNTEKQLLELGQSERERNRQLEWLRFEVQEIEEARLLPEEDAEIEANIRRLAAAEELGQRSRQALLHVDNALDGVGQAQKQLSALVRLDPAASFVEQAALCESQLGELSHALNRYQDDLQGEPEQLDLLQARAELLRTLKRKYGPDVAAILAYGAEARQKLIDLENAEEKLEHLQQRQRELSLQLKDLAGRLSSSRQKQARLLEKEVQLQLADLNLENMRFEVHQQAGELGPQGADQLEFYLAPNPGTPPRPLAKIASGGELSRIMLAVIGIFAKFEPLTTLIFDEIDAGLGGRAAEAVARKLGLLAKQRQVLCVTHLAVIAAAGDQHIRVSKESDSERTQLELTTLTGKTREAEIARMLSGDAGAASAQRLARELLRKS